MSNGLTQKERKELALAMGIGKASVLAVGVGTQFKGSGFSALKTCVNDALDVAQAFKDIPQLHADPDRVHVLTSSMPGGVSRGAIIAALKALTANTEEGERVIFFFSGHGWRIENEFYLVPQDAWDAEDPNALLAFSTVEAILNTSAAKQKIVILDACLSGPDTSSFKSPLAKVSEKFLAEYLKVTKGLVRLSAATADTVAHTQSPNPKHSLFTHFVLEGLQGAPDALTDQRFLTIPSLYEFVSVRIKQYAKSAQIGQKPAISNQSDGVIVVGDFGGSILQPENLNLPPSAAELTFSDEVGAKIQEFLPNRQRRFSPEHLQRVINERVLPSEREDQLGRFKSTLRNRYGYSGSDVSVEGRYLVFPDGSYEVEFIAENETRGVLQRKVNLRGGWLQRLSEIEELLKVFNMGSPDELEISLQTRINVPQSGNMLRSSGWNVELELDKRVEASRGGFKIEVRTDSVRVWGFTPTELFGANADKEKASLLQVVLQGLAPAPKSKPMLPAAVSVRSLERVPAAAETLKAHARSDDETE